MGKKLMLLDILIPTFNREKDLEKNLKLLISFIENLNLLEEVKIIVSDNCSTDNTLKMLESIIQTTDVKIIFFKQGVNIGLEKNAVFVLSKSKSEYVMYLGDDDFLQFEYFQEVIKSLNNKLFTCIVPSFLAKTKDNKIIGSRSLGKNKIYNKGFNAVYNMLLLGHQLSGIVFLREGTLEKYVENKSLRNIYLFMSFVGFNCLRGNALNLTEYPVSVTVGEKKDWNYGKDALFNEAIKNIPPLYPSGWNRFMLEYRFYISNIYSINTIYPSRKKKLKALYLSSVSKNLSLPFKVYIPIALCLFGISKVCKFIGDR